jgi:hypothetical protein
MKIASFEEKIYRGAFEYFKSKNLFAEETFEVFRDKRDMSYRFQAKCRGRVSTGEILVTDLNYRITKDFVPIEVTIDKTLGVQKIRERFLTLKNKSKVTYTFAEISVESDEEIGDVHEETFQVPPKFHILTHSAISSLFYIKSKKFDTTAKNYYICIASSNLWSFEKTPEIRTIAVERLTNLAESVKLGDSNVEGHKFKVYNYEAKAPEDEIPPFLELVGSPHLSIPYIVESEDGNLAQIKYLNHMDSDG